MIHFDNECPQKECWHTVSVVEDIETYRMCAIQSPSLYCKACVNLRTDSERYAELRALVEDTQREAMDPASSLVIFDNTLRLLLDWKHR